MRTRVGARHPTCLAYRLPVAAAVTAATVVATSAPAGKPTVICEKGAARHPDSQMYRDTTTAAAAAAVSSSSAASAAPAAATGASGGAAAVVAVAGDGDESGASSREVALAAQLLDVQRRARGEHDYWKKRVDEMKGAVVVYRKRAEDVERNLELAMVSRVNQTLFTHLYIFYLGYVGRAASGTAS